jgi:hypothetical protein
MAHECPDCGTMCYCDIEDHMNSAASDECTHYLTDECAELQEPMEDDGAVDHDDDGNPFFDAEDYVPPLPPSRPKDIGE